MSINTKPVIAICALICMVAFASIADNQICVNFGSKTKAKGWNSMPNKAKSIADLVNAQGEKSGISLKVIIPFSGVNHAGTKKAKKELNIPGAVSSNSLWGDNKKKKVVIEISGLDKANKYKLIFFASRMSAKDNRETLYEVVGASTKKVTLNAANNSDNVAEIAAIQPDDKGKLVITLKKGAKNNNKSGWFYLNALKISESK